MKTKSIFFLMLCIFAFSIANAFEPETMVKKTLTSKVTYPQKAQDQMIEGSVTVSFIVEDDGKVVVTSATSASDVLKQGVVDQLKTTVIEPNPAYKNNTYSIKFSFELIK
jgi:TonB family protein